MKESSKSKGGKGRYVVWNLLAMAVVCLLAFLGIRYGLNTYTHHGESIAIPDVREKSTQSAIATLEGIGMAVEVVDTGYVKTLPPDCVLEQTPEAGQHVKSGHLVRLVVNAQHAPTLKLPDIIDNSSLRTAMSRLSAMGFKVGVPEFVPGEKDWVVGVKADGKPVDTGDKISVNATVVRQAGNGMVGADDSITYVDPSIDAQNYDDYEYGDVDDFEVVEAPPSDSN